MERPDGALVGGRWRGGWEDLLSIPELHPRMRVTQNSHTKVERPEVSECTLGAQLPVFG